uniref:Uncharacterized protein n=1 Tax=Oryza brachyantha TaxID=4533 RepID=J3M899_ORYBR
MEEIDKLCEVNGMTYIQKEKRDQLEKQLKIMMREDEIKWFQRSKEKEIIEGDNNTKYYNAKANGSKRKDSIEYLEQEEGVIHGQENLMVYITNFYKNLFSQPDSIQIRMQEGKLEVERLNYGVITLIPKCKQAVQIQKYRPICLLNMLEGKGFPHKWNDWIMSVIRGGKVSIKVNNQEGRFFPTHKGLRQGDPLSPIMFDIAADALAILMEKAQNSGLIKGLEENMIEGGLMENKDSFMNFCRWRLVEKVLTNDWIAMRFRRALIGSKAESWERLKEKCEGINLSEDKDVLCNLARLVWSVIKWTFAVNMMNNRNDLFDNWMRGFNKATKNLVAIGVSAVLWSIWKIRNNACFQDKFPNDPVEIKGDRAGKLENGARLLKQVAMEIYDVKHGWGLKTKRLKGWAGSFFISF